MAKQLTKQIVSDYLNGTVVVKSIGKAYKLVDGTTSRTITLENPDLDTLHRKLQTTQEEFSDFLYTVVEDDPDNVKVKVNYLRNIAMILEDTTTAPEEEEKMSPFKEMMYEIINSLHIGLNIVPMGIFYASDDKDLEAMKDRLKEIF